MPRQRELDYYGQSCYNILVGAYTKSKRMHFDTEGEASTYRRTLYNYRYALRDAAHEGHVSAGTRYAECMRVQICLQGASLLIKRKPQPIVQEANYVVSNEPSPALV